MLSLFGKFLKATVVITVILILFGVLAQQAFGQNSQSQETITIPKNQATPQQVAQAEQDDLAKRIERYGKFAGVGKEIGVAVNDSLAAVTNQAAAFANTTPGKITIAVVVWKVIGKDIQAYLYVLGVLFFFVPIWLWSYRRYLPRRFLVKETHDKDTGKLVEREYAFGYGQKYMPDNYSKNKAVLNSDDAHTWCAIHWAIMLVVAITCLFAIFGG